MQWTSYFDHGPSGNTLRRPANLSNSSSYSVVTSNASSPSVNMHRALTCWYVKEGHREQTSSVAVGSDPGRMSVKPIVLQGQQAGSPVEGAQACQCIQQIIVNHVYRVAIPCFASGTTWLVGLQPGGDHRRKAKRQRGQESSDNERRVGDITCRKSENLFLQSEIRAVGRWDGAHPGGPILRSYRTTFGLAPALV
jgi:hypothetical protein